MILNESSKIRQIGCTVKTNLTGGTVIPLVKFIGLIGPLVSYYNVATSLSNRPALLK